MHKKRKEHTAIEPPFDTHTAASHRFPGRSAVSQSNIVN